MPNDNDDTAEQGDDETPEKERPASYGDRDERFTLDADPTDAFRRILNHDSASHS